MKKLNLEKLTLRSIVYFPIFRQARPDFFRVCLQLSRNWEKTLQFKQPRQKPIVLQLKVNRCNKLINDKIKKREYN